jgi:hypothetical protein
MYICKRSCVRSEVKKINAATEGIKWSCKLYLEGKVQQKNQINIIVFFFLEQINVASSVP